MKFALIIIITFIISTVITPLVIKLAKRFKLLDDALIRKHPAHTHSGIIPRAGGLSIFSAILIASLLFLPNYKPRDRSF